MALLELAKFVANEIRKEPAFNTMGVEFEPNPLGNVEQPSYHWKLYLGSDIGVTTRPVVTIAETGKTSLNILSVEIEHAGLTPNFQTKNMSSMVFTIKIAEPFGVSLPDKLLAAANYARVKNFLRAPYILSLDFLGYDPETGEPKKAIEKTWTWRLQMQKIDTDVDSTGSTHTIRAVMFDNAGTSDIMSVLQFPTKIDLTDKEAKVGDVMKEIEKQINKSIEKSHNVANGGVVPYIVEIKDVPYRNNAPVGSPFEHKILREVKQWDTSRNQEYVQLSQGTDLGRIVDYLMSASETATQMINPANSSTSNDSSAKEYSTMHRVETTLENIDYNKVTQDYVRKLTFYIIGQDNVRAISSAKSADEAAAQGAVKLQFVTSQNYLKKEYDWIFTGKNTEVIDCKVNLNFEFHVAKNIYEGYINSNVSSVGKEYNPEEKNVISQNMGWELNQPAKSPLESTWEIAEGIVDKIGDAIGDFILNVRPETDVDNLPMEALPLPTTFTQDADDQHIGKSIETNSIRNRSIYSMILNQMYGLNTAQLQQVDLEIRGDPYWLGKTEEDGIFAASDNYSPNFLHGEHMFVLRFFIPQGMDEEGKPILQLTDIYSGFYGVQKVIHKFVDGKFTQSLNAVRIPAMSVIKLLGES